MKEKEIQKQITDYLSKFPTQCSFRTSERHGKRNEASQTPVGWPDISGDWSGEALYIEVKGKDGKASKEQILFIEKARRRGAIALFAYSLEDVVGALGHSGRI